MYTPPFTLTDDIVSLVSEISEDIGRIAVISKNSEIPRLRRKNRIRTIHSSLCIEQNTLSLEQVTSIINGKRVLGSPNEI